MQIVILSAFVFVRCVDLLAIDLTLKLPRFWGIAVSEARFPVLSLEFLLLVPY